MLCVCMQALRHFRQGEPILAVPFGFALSVATISSRCAQLSSLAPAMLQVAVGPWKVGFQVGLSA